MHPSGMIVILDRAWARQVLTGRFKKTPTAVAVGTVKTEKRATRLMPSLARVLQVVCLAMQCHACRKSQGNATGVVEADSVTAAEATRVWL